MTHDLGDLLRQDHLRAGYEAALAKHLAFDDARMPQRVEWLDGSIELLELLPAVQDGALLARALELTARQLAESVWHASSMAPRLIEQLQGQMSITLARRANAMSEEEYEPLKEMLLEQQKRIETAAAAAREAVQVRPEARSVAKKIIEKAEGGEKAAGPRGSGWRISPN